MAGLDEELLRLSVHDPRIGAADLAFEIEAQLREGGALKAVLTDLREDADRAMQDFAVANPADINAIIALQARVFRFSGLLGYLEGITARGQIAARGLMDDDLAGRGTSEDASYRD